MRELHWWCYRNLEQLLWHCGIACGPVMGQSSVKSSLRSWQPQRLLWPKAGVIFYPQLKQRQKEYRDQVERVWSTEFLMLNLKIHDRPKIFIIIMFAPKLPWVRFDFGYFGLYFLFAAFGQLLILDELTGACVPCGKNLKNAAKKLCILVLSISFQ